MSKGDEIIAWMRLKSAVIGACQRRRDSARHQDALLRELEDPEITDPADWAWYTDYFEDQGK